VAVIAFFSGSYCHANEIIAGVTKRLSYEPIDERLLDETADRYGVGRNRLERAMTGPDPFFNRLTREREKNLAYIGTVLAEMILKDNTVLHGCYGHLIPRTISHILKTCIIANHDYRIRQAVDLDNISEKEAHKRIHQNDERNFVCTGYLFEKPAYDESLYDLVIPMHDTSVANAIDMICDYAVSDPLQTTERSLQAARDFVLAAKVKLVLVQEGFNVEVHAEKGQVMLLQNEYVVRMKHQEEQLREIVSGIDQVETVTLRKGPKFHMPSLNPWSNIEGPPKILLVDDEKEFVHTLSERLQTRDLASSIAYDGEQALSMIKEEVPDVMVLDLMMPGIDGIEVLRRIKQDHPKVEVIILTGHGSEKEQQQAEELGAFAYLHKPVNIDNLAKVMREAYARANRLKGGHGPESSVSDE